LILTETTESIEYIDGRDGKLGTFYLVNFLWVQSPPSTQKTPTGVLNIRPYISD